MQGLGGSAAVHRVDRSARRHDVDPVLNGVAAKLLEQFVAEPADQRIAGANLSGTNVNAKALVGRFGAGAAAIDGHHSRAIGAAIDVHGRAITSQAPG